MKTLKQFVLEAKQPTAAAYHVVAYDESGKKTLHGIHATKKDADDEGRNTSAAGHIVFKKVGKVVTKVKHSKEPNNEDEGISRYSHEAGLENATKFVQKHK